MIVHTRSGRSIELPPNQIVSFLKPILGFEGMRHFALYPASEAPPFHWLQSIQDRGLAFPLVPASELGVQYTVDAEALHCMNAKSPADLEYWVIMALPTDGGEPRANLRAPIVLHPKQHTAAQIIMREEYPLRSKAPEKRRELAHAR